MIEEKVGVIIATYGDVTEWTELARRAANSVNLQSHQADVVVWEHADTLQHARNWGAAKCKDCDWLIFLDADDELDPLYIEAMLDGRGDIRRPATLGVYGDGSEDDQAVMIPERRLSDANYIVIGAMVRRSLFFNIGGFDDYPCLEDWALWQRLVLNGATVGHVPGAIYRVHVRADSRNADQESHDLTYHEIRWKFEEAWRQSP